MKRTSLRQKFGLREEPCGDCPTALCCGPCALCQEARFLKRGGRYKRKIVVIEIFFVFLQVVTQVRLELWYQGLCQLQINLVHNIKDDNQRRFSFRFILIFI